MTAPTRRITRHPERRPRNGHHPDCPPMWPMYLVVAMAALVLLSLAVALLRGDFEDESMRLDCTPNGSNLTCEERR